MAMYRRALKTLPGGTNSNFRAWGDDTVYIDRGKGATVWDLDGNEYIDLRMGYGPVILGHGDDRVDDHVNERMRRGVSFSLTSEDEVQRDGAHLRAHRLGQEGAHDGLRDRGDDARDADRPGLHRPLEDREVRGPVPRRPRLRPDQRTPDDMSRARRQREPGRAGLGPRDPRGGRRDDHPGPLQRARRPAPDLRARRRRHRRRDHRAGPRQRPGDHAPAGLPRGDPGAHRRVRRRSSSTTRSRPASASPAAAPPSTSA